MRQSRIDNPEKTEDEVQNTTQKTNKVSNTDG